MSRRALTLFAVGLACVRAAAEPRPRTGRSGADPAARGSRPRRSCRPSGRRTRTSRGRSRFPPGHSSPIVWGDRMFVTAVVEGEVVPGRESRRPHHGRASRSSIPTAWRRDRKHTLKVLALDAKTGKIALGSHVAYEGPVYDARHRRSSFAGPTAVTDGSMVYAYFGPEGLYAYDFSGKLAWKVVEKFTTLGLGTGTSPVLFQNLVIIQRDEDNGERVGRSSPYDKQTGKEAWTHEAPGADQLEHAGAGRRPGTAPSSSPTATSSSSPTTRRPARSCGGRTGVESNAIHTPLVGNGLVIVTAGYPAKKVIAIRPGEVAADKRVAWEYAKGTGYVVSNILYGDYLYLLTDNGIVTCLDAADGRR